MTVSTLRPNATTSSSLTLTGAATVHAALSDNSDSSYITGVGVGQFYTVQLADISLPSGALVKTLALRIRGAAPSITGEAEFYLVDRLNSVTLIDTITTVFWTSISTVTIGTVSGQYTQAAINSMDTSMVVRSNDVSVHEVYFDVTYVVKPTVVANTPTGTLTTTNTPTVTWTPTLDGDGGAQTYWQVRIYNAAQYTAGGFDPLTTPSVVDSHGDGPNGVATGTNTSWQATQVLPDDTYRAYVRVAQTVNGQQHWSDFAFTGWVQLVAIPGVPTLVATADNVNAKIALALTDAVGGAATSNKFELQRSVDGTTWTSVRTRDGAGAVLVPWVAGLGTYSDTGDTTSHNLNLPAPLGGIQANDILLAVVGMDGDPTLTWPTGWATLKDIGSGTLVRTGVAWKRAAGNESGTIQLVTNVAEGGGADIFCIRGAHRTAVPEVSTGVSALTSTPNPDSLDPAAWGTENTLWIAAVAHDNAASGVISGPSGWFDYQDTRWNSANGAGIATATKMAATASQDPGTFSVPINQVHAFTMAIRPFNATLANTADYEAPNGTTMSYRARALHDYNGVWAASAWSTPDTEAWTSLSWWLKHPNKPTLNMPVKIRSFKSFDRPARQGEFQALGSAVSIVVSDTRQPARGTVTFLVNTAADQLKMDALILDGGVLLLQSPLGHGGPDYISAGNFTRERVIDWHFPYPSLDTIEWVAVATPLGVYV